MSPSPPRDPRPTKAERQALAKRKADAACLLAETAEWFRDYRDRDKLVHSFTHPDGQ